MSDEIQSFRTTILDFLSNIAADLNRVLGRNPGLSAEDKAALQEISDKAAEVAGIVPED